MLGNTLRDKIKRFDVYQKIPKEYCQSTFFGALISSISLGVMIFLFFTEWNYNSQIYIDTDMTISNHTINEKVQINFDIVLHSFPCDIVSIDIMDVMGHHQVHAGQHVTRKRLNAEGEFIEDYQAMEKDPDKIQDHSEEINFDRLKKAIEDQEGCHLLGYIEVNKVPGNFHISAHGFHSTLHQVANHFKRNIIQYNLAHTINHLSFGNKRDIRKIQRKFSKDAKVAPIDGFQSPSEYFMTYDYYFKVSETTYEDLEGHQYLAHQFDSNFNSFIMYQRIPAIWLKYDLSPIAVKFTQQRKRFLDFVISMCAILGGIFTIAGIIDSVVHKSLTVVLKKAQMGKLA